MILKNHCIALGMELYRAMNQLVLDVKRLHNEEERHFARGVQFPEAICASGDQVADWVEGKLMQEALHKAITILPDTQRRRLELYYFAGLTYEQIAALEGCSYPAVIKSVKKAIVELRRYLM